MDLASFAILLTLGVIAYIGYHARLGYQGKTTAPGLSPGARYVCTVCHSRVEPRSEARGILLLGIVLWLFFIIPGLLYTIWCMSGGAKVCPICAAPNPVPVTSPAGQRILQNNP